MPDTLILYRDEADAGLDLSLFVDVTNGGLNFGDDQIQAPVYAEQSIGYGAPLITERLNNRDVTVNLIMSASTRDALLGLERSIRERLDGRRPHITWTPEGATGATTYRIRYGRLVGGDKYDYWRERSLAARRLLLLTCAPYGEGSRRRSSDLTVRLASHAGFGFVSGIMPSNPAIVAMGSVGGDVPAAMRIAFAAASHASAPNPAWAGFVYGFTKQPSYLPAFLSAGASLLRMYDGTAYGPTTFLADVFAPAASGQVIQMIGTYLPSGAPANFAQIVQQTKGAMPSYGVAAPDAGRYRAFLAARARTNIAGWARLQLKDPMGNVGPIATLPAGPSGWVWADMGDVMIGPTALNFYVAAYYPSGGAASFVASPAINLAALALIPKDIAYGHLQPASQDNLATMALIADGLDGEGPLRAGGKIGLGSLAAIPLGEASGAWAYDAPFIGAKPELIYTPSGQATGPLMVTLGLRSSASGAMRNDQGIIAYVLQDRYIFAR